jgi:hypothetical protein
VNTFEVDVQQVSYKECSQLVEEWNQLSRKASELKCMCDEEHVMFNSRKKHNQDQSTSSLYIYLLQIHFFLFVIATLK